MMTKMMTKMMIKTTIKVLLVFLTVSASAVPFHPAWREGPKDNSMNHRFKEVSNHKRVVSVPEPSTLGIMGAGVIALVAIRRRKK